MARTLRISGVGEADKQDKSAWHLVFSWWVGAVSCQQVNILETLQWVSWYPGLKNGYCVYITSKNQVRKGSGVREVGGCLRQEHKVHIPGGTLAAVCWLLSSIQHQRNHTDGHTGLGWGQGTTLAFHLELWLLLTVTFWEESKSALSTFHRTQNTQNKSSESSPTNKTQSEAVFSKEPLEL